VLRAIRTIARIAMTTMKHCEEIEESIITKYHDLAFAPALLASSTRSEMQQVRQVDQDRKTKVCLLPSIHGEAQSLCELNGSN
jgi:hypothetical protein